MAATKKTTVKPIALEYAAVGNSLLATPVAGTKVMGVLKGFAVGQDAFDETKIESEFFDNPFDIIYDGKPITFKFELANYMLSDLPPLFGGTYTAATATVDESYEAPTTAFSSEWEWKLSYQRGNRGLLIYKGKTVGTIKNDNKASLNYSVIITSLVYNDGTNDHMWKIIGDAKTGS